VAHLGTSLSIAATRSRSLAGGRAGELRTLVEVPSAMAVKRPGLILKRPFGW
jgi:hypothetical protein